MIDDAFRAFADTTPLLIRRAAPGRGCIFVNRCWLEFTGRAFEEELGGGWVRNVHPNDRERCLAAAKAFDGRQEVSLEYRLRRRDGAFRWIAESAHPVWELDGIPGSLSACVDITPHKTAAEATALALAETSAALRDKDAALTEVHHRARNNLQVTLSLVGLYGRAAGPEAQSHFQAFAQHIRAISAVQEHLHDTTSLARIDLRDYLQRLAASLAQLAPPQSLSIAVRGAAPGVERAQANAIGMILIEALRETLRAATENAPHRAVAIEIDERDGAMSLRVGGHEATTAEGKLGARLMHAYAAQAGIELAEDDGLRLTLPQAAPHAEEPSKDGSSGSDAAHGLRPMGAEID